ncbi:hypothetical protein EJ05DRAFT_481689 [Pseudovirgaria hyperparasitica]|uniref:BRCT domain-containing protein n=1 Tax=Pseudovirgaria hyperparasitica TaxID=470096 RepID=A0A6A6WKU3_9PEZI|nr:uncharacterized protein EJ05DRAFT_481689 [Pseudovirgaria hyperparasitica]KAF2762808.1 hypothetical protein EJ05DRAFT_481689 [Pseudovirgaria hyperparasitica]
MGAIHKFDLTSDVTHLLVGDVETNKYRYVAKERPDVKVVLPQWLEAVRLSWMEGGETDVAALETEHKAPPLYKLRLSITGFDDLLFRQSLSETIISNGAHYSGDLTKQTTHLLAARPEGKKYGYARQWGIKVVSLKWLQDTITRGMALDEAAYDPLKPEEEQGKGAFTTLTTTTTVVTGKRLRPEQQHEASGEPQVRKLRRTASTKLGSQNESIWADITSHSATDRRRSDGQWLDLDKTSSESAILSLVPPAAASAHAPDVTAEAVPEPRAPVLELVQPEDGIFQRRVVHIHGFDEKKTTILLQHLSANGAMACTRPAELAALPLEKLEDGFLIVPDDAPVTRLPPLPELAQRLLKVTNWWVEKCLHNKTLIDPTEDALCRPFAKIHINGAVYDEYLKPTTSVLICGPLSANKEKLSLAAKNSIPAVTQDWLSHSIESGERRPYKQYLVQPIRSINHETGEQAIEKPKPTKQLPEEEKSAVSKGKSGASSERAAAHGRVPQRPTNGKTKRKLGGELPPQNLGRPDDSISKPLAELPQATTSPRRRSATTSTNTSNKSHKSASEQNLDQPSRPSSPDPEPVMAVEQPHLENAIAALRAQKQAARAPSAAAPEMLETNRQRRRRGLLGRAHSSATSNTSTGDPDSHVLTNHAEASSSNVVEAPESWPQQNADSAAAAVVEQEAPPQTQLVYDNPEARRAREILLAKMGGKMEEEASPAKGIGVVKDLGGGSSIGAGSGVTGGTTTRQARRRR